MTDSSTSSRLTRRQFGWRVAAASAAAVGLGAAGTGEWLHVKHKRQFMNSMDPNVTGENSLASHAAAKGLIYGTAVRPALMDVEGIATGSCRDGYTHLVAAQAAMLADEYTTDWKWVRPSPDRFDFTQPDRLMRFAKLTGKLVRGQILCWHMALPDWFRSKATHENARQLLSNHIQALVERYRGQIHSWIVVNEAIEPMDGRADGLRKSPWLELIGPGYIELAFRTAADADPNAKLVYNDYGIETDSERDAKKRDQVLALLQRLKASGTPVHAVGIQSHLYMARQPSGAGLQGFIREAGKMGLEAHITELDVNCRRMEGGQEKCDAIVAGIYQRYLDLVLAEPNVPLITTFGTTDAHTWLKLAWLLLPNPEDKRGPWAKFVEGMRQRPLPFDDDFAAKPAFWALRGAFDGAQRA